MFNGLPSIFDQKYEFDMLYKVKCLKSQNIVEFAHKTFSPLEMFISPSNLPYSHLTVECNSSLEIKHALAFDVFYGSEFYLFM